MSIKDARGKEIEIGSFIRYTGTGTVGKIIEIKEEDEESWLKLDENPLWYCSSLVEVVDESVIMTSRDNRRDDNSIDNIKDLKDDFEDINIVSGGAEGGG
ncbi:MAG: DUF2098 domain-containing protein [Methanobrevibacter sp.]|nr:DUF2098 domain-containing protein [Methanobrevibacter sp.]